jgi:two-component system sensor histidine kinase KdpD
VIEAALERIREKGDCFEVTGDRDLPVVWADAAQLERAFANLFENSIRFAGTAPVEVSLVMKGDRVVVRVSDSGPGVASADSEAIFEPFYRGNVDGRGSRGPGLGLAIVKGFVAANGGSVRVESRPGQGATFVVELPVGGAEASRA